MAFASFDLPHAFARAARLALLVLVIEPLSAAYTWRNVAIGGGGYVTGVEYHPEESGLAYARTDVGGAYRRDSATSPWIPLNDDIGGLNNEFMTLGVLSVAMDRSDPDRVYLACGQYLEWWAPAARLLRSTDRGATWTQVALPFKLAGNGDGRGTGERLSVDPHDGLRLLLGTSADGLWRSLDRGATWIRLAGFTPSATTFVLHDPSNFGVVYAGVPVLDAPTLWRSTDGGGTWAPVPGQATGLMALQGKIDSAGTLYLAYANGLGPNGVTAGAVRKLSSAASAGSAAFWTDINPPAGQGGFCGLALDALRPGVVVVSTLNRWWPRDEIYRSTDGGLSWKGALDGAATNLASAPWASELKPHWITDVEIDPFDSGRGVFVTGYGVFSTGNLAVATGKPAWAFDSAGLEETVVSGLVSPASGPPLVSTIGDFDGFRHDSLDTSPAARHSPARGTNRGLVGAGAAPAVLARLHGTGSISRDGGLAWTEFPASPPTASGEGRLALSADGARLLWCPAGSAPWWSSDDGQSWTASAGLPGGGDLTPAGDSSSPGVFYIHDPTTRRVSRSSDGGASFSVASPQLPTGLSSLRATPGRAGELWAACGTNGLRRLTVNGSSLATVANVGAAYAVGFGRAANGADHPAVFIWGTVAGVTGIHRSDDVGASWIRINDDAHRFGHISALTGDPRVHGRVYLATGGRGIVVGEPVVEPLQSAVLYEEALAPGWQNWSWASVDLASSSPTRRGARAVAVTAGAYQGFYLSHSGVDTSGYAAVGFWIHGGTSGGQSLGLRARVGGVDKPAVNLSAPVAGGWTRVVVSLSELGAAGVPNLDGLIIQSRSGSALPAFYLDDIALVGALDQADWATQDYASWRARVFGDAAVAAGASGEPAADPDGDGRANRHEWLLLSDPLAADAGAWTTLALDARGDEGAYYEFSYTSRGVAAGDEGVVEQSADLATWSPLAEGDGAGVFLEPLDISGIAQRVRWRVPASGRARWFVRLR